MVKLLAIKKTVKLRGPGGEIVEVPALVPAYRAEIEGFKKLPTSRVIEAALSVPRNTALHRKFFAILNYTFDNLPEDYGFKNLDQFIDYIKFEIGYTTAFKIRGNIRIIPRSIAYRNADEITFQNDFYNPAVNLMAEILGLTLDELEDGSLQYNGPDYKNERNF